MTRADVNYDVIQSAKWPPAQVDSTVPWTNAGVFAVSPKLYAPVLEGTAQDVTHIHITGHRLAATRAKTSRIYDLDAATLTTINFEESTYRVETLDGAYRQYRQIAGYNADRNFHISALKTGKTVRLYDLEATEYAIVATGKRLGRRKVAARLLCWVADRIPSAELDEFRRIWSARTSLPFLLDLLPADGASDAYVAMVKAQTSIPGYVLGFVTEAKTVESRIDLDGRPSAVYQASQPQLPSLRAAETTRNGVPGVTYDPLVQQLAKDRLIQINLLNFTNTAVDPAAFVIPLGFKQTGTTR